MFSVGLFSFFASPDRLMCICDFPKSLIEDELEYLAERMMEEQGEYEEIECEESVFYEVLLPEEFYHPAICVKKMREDVLYYIEDSNGVVWSKDFPLSKATEKSSVKEGLKDTDFSFNSKLNFRLNQGIVEVFDKDTGNQIEGCFTDLLYVDFISFNLAVWTDLSRREISDYVFCGNRVFQIGACTNGGSRTKEIKLKSKEPIFNKVTNVICNCLILDDEGKIWYIESTENICNENVWSLKVVYRETPIIQIIERYKDDPIIMIDENRSLLTINLEPLLEGDDTIDRVDFEEEIVSICCNDERAHILGRSGKLCFLDFRDIFDTDSLKIKEYDDPNIEKIGRGCLSVLRHPVRKQVM